MKIGFKVDFETDTEIIHVPFIFQEWNFKSKSKICLTVRTDNFGELECFLEENCSASKKDCLTASIFSGVWP